MNKNRQIYLRDISGGSVRTISRADAKRQFKLSFALVLFFVVGALIVVSVLPVSNWDHGYGTTAERLAQN
jgi:hypothetical protein